jgi:hypothetical protein
LCAPLLYAMLASTRQLDTPESSNRYSSAHGERIQQHKTSHSANFEMEAELQ